MGEYCRNCGFFINAGDRVCQRCKTAPKGKNPKGFKGKIIGVTVAIAAVFLLVTAFAGIYTINYYSSYKPVLKSFSNAIGDHNFKAIKAMSSRVFCEEIHMYSNTFRCNYYRDCMEYSLEEKYRMYRENVGEIIKITPKVTKETKWSDGKLSDLRTELRNTYDLDAGKIKEVVVIEGIYTVKGKKGTFSDDFKYMMVREGSKWYVWWDPDRLDYN